MSSFASRLTKLREKHDMKKSELASILHVSSACVSQYEQGKTMPGYDVLIRIANHFGVSTDYLLGNRAPGLCCDLDEVYCDSTTYNELLEICSNVPPDQRSTVLQIIKTVFSK